MGVTRAGLGSALIVLVVLGGVLHANGTGVTEDVVKATILYQKVCDVVKAAGGTSLGVLQENGTGVTEDVAKAATLYQKGLCLRTLRCLKSRPVASEVCMVNPGEVLTGRRPDVRRAFTGA